MRMIRRQRQKKKKNPLEKELKDTKDQLFESYGGIFKLPQAQRKRKK